MNLSTMDILIYLAALLFAIFLYGKWKMNHFDGRNMKYVKPFLPFFGSTLKVAFRREHFIDFQKRHYNSFPGEKYIGLYEASRPLIFMRDVNLIKQMAIKEFETFPQHRSSISEEVDSLIGNSLISLGGEKWKDMRGTLSPAFTSAKMRNMFVFIEECAKDVANHYLNDCQRTGKNLIEIEAKDTFSRYTNDVIANSAFGLKVQSLTDRKNEFYEITKEATALSGVQFIKFVLVSTFPAIMKILNISFISYRAKQFYRRLVNDTMKIREEQSIVRHDMIHLLMEAKKGALKHEKNMNDSSDVGFATVEESTIGKREVKRKWTDDELVAQALIFLIGGFETSATFITFFIYELIRNPDVQQKLQQEIDEYISENGKNITYDALPKLKYLDACVTESLRMWPPIVALDRICTKPYTLPPPNEYSKDTYKMKPDEAFWVPIYAIHFDSKYYPNPEKFDPERFSDENKPKLEPGAYLPFGIGPRNCIGSRFALMTGKLIMFHMLSKFDFVATNKTQIPLKLKLDTLNLVVDGGLQVGLQKRNL